MEFIGVVRIQLGQSKAHWPFGDDDVERVP